MVEERYLQLEEDHVIRVMVEEHERILGFLDRLDGLVNDYRDAIGTPQARTILAQIHTIGENLLAAEPHHAREEEVLFPELYRVGIQGPPQCMTEEHDRLRSLKRLLVEQSAATSLDTEAMAETARTLSSMLRDHIAKENEILYPMALSALPESTWESLKAACDRIGPCAFVDIGRAEKVP